MASWTVWRRYTREVLDKMPAKRGAYEIASRNKTIVDSGSSDSDGGTKSRLIERLIHNRCPTGYFFRCQYVGFLDRGSDIEGKTTRRIIAKTGKRPKYNKRTPSTSNYPFM
jgi:hypothetical protein